MNWKKLLSVCLCVAMLLSILPVQTMAEGQGEGAGSDNTVYLSGEVAGMRITGGTEADPLYLIVEDQAVVTAPIVIRTGTVVLKGGGTLTADNVKMFDVGNLEGNTTFIMEDVHLVQNGGTCVDLYSYAGTTLVQMNAGTIQGSGTGKAFQTDLDQHGPSGIANLHTRLELNGGTISGFDTAVAARFSDVVLGGAEITDCKTGIDTTDGSCNISVASGSISASDTGVRLTVGTLDMRGGVIRGAHYGVRSVSPGQEPPQTFFNMSGGSIQSCENGVFNVYRCDFTGGEIADCAVGVQLYDLSTAARNAWTASFGGSFSLRGIQETGIQFPSDAGYFHPITLSGFAPAEPVSISIPKLPEPSDGGQVVFAQAADGVVFTNADAAHFVCRNTLPDGEAYRVAKASDTELAVYHPDTLDPSVCSHPDVVTDPAVEPTCTATGLTEGSHCGRCGAVLVAQETVPKLPHTPGEPQNAVEPTATEDGYSGDIYCTVCGALLEAGHVLYALNKTENDIHWADGDVIEEQTIVGGTAEDPVVIMVEGEVTLTGEVTIASGYVRIEKSVPAGLNEEEAASRNYQLCTGGSGKIHATGGMLEIVDLTVLEKYSSDRMIDLNDGVELICRNVVLDGAGYCKYGIKGGKSVKLYDCTVRGVSEVFAYAVSGCKELIAERTTFENNYMAVVALAWLTDCDIRNNEQAFGSTAYLTDCRVTDNRECTTYGALYVSGATVIDLVDLHQGNANLVVRDALSEGASITVRGAGEAHKVAGGKGSQIRTSEYGISFTTYYATEADASYFHYAPSASELNGNGVYSQPYLNQTTNHVVIDVSYKMYLARTAGCTVAPELHEETDGAFTALDDAHGTLQTESDGRGYFLVSDEGYTWYSLKIEPGYERGENFAILQGDTALEWQTEKPGETRMQKFLKAPALLRSGEDEGETLYFRVSADDQTELTITGIEQQTVTLKGLSLVFDDIPRLKYYCVIPDSLKSDPDAYLAFLSEEGEELSRTPISEGTAGTYKNTPCTIFYYSVVPKAAEDVVHLRFFTGDGTPVRLVTGSGKDYSEQGFPFSMKDYAENMKVHGSTEKMRNLAAALDDYCAAAVTYFGTGNSPVSAELANITPEMLAPYAVVKEGVLPAGIVKPQMSVMFQTDNSIRVYFVYDKNSGKAPTDYTYTIDGEQAELLERDGQYYLTVTGIGAKELGIAHTFSVSDGTDTYSITASTLTYAGLLLGQNKEASKNLGRALYQYCKAAEANFAS